MTSACSSGRLCVLLVLIVLIGFSSCHAADAGSKNETEHSKEESTPDQWALFYEVVNKLQDTFEQLRVLNMSIGENRIKDITEFFNGQVLDSGAAGYAWTSETVREMMEKFPRFIDELTEHMKDGKENMKDFFDKGMAIIVDGWDKFSSCNKFFIFFVLGMVTGVVIGPLLLTLLLHLLGFGATGIVAPSMATFIQAAWYGGFTTGLFSLLQGWAMGGIPATVAMMMGAAGGAIAWLGAVVGL
jgi:hypothetical protein